MSYRIAYGKDKHAEKQNKIWQQPGIWAVLAVIAGVVCACWLWPDALETIRGLVYPLTDEFVLATFQSMLERIGSGESVGEAITVFCREIISNADLAG